VPRDAKWSSRRARLSGVMADAGRGRALTAEQRELLLDIRAEHRNASVPLILRTLELAKVFEPDTASAQTVRRLYREAGLTRLSRKEAHGDTSEARQRLRWQTSHVCALWHGDVCHALRITDETGTIHALVHALMDDCSRYIVRLEVRATEQRAILWLRGEYWELHIQPVFPRDAGAAAWVVPFEVQPTVFESSADFFDQLERLRQVIPAQVERE